MRSFEVGAHRGRARSLGRVRDRGDLTARCFRSGVPGSTLNTRPCPPSNGAPPVVRPLGDPRRSTIVDSGLQNFRHHREGVWGQVPTGADLEEFVSYLCLVYHEARNVRRLIKDGHLEAGPYEPLRRLPKNREEAWGRCHTGRRPPQAHPDPVARHWFHRGQVASS